MFSTVSTHTLEVKFCQNEGQSFSCQRADFDDSVLTGSAKEIKWAIYIIH